MCDVDDVAEPYSNTYVQRGGGRLTGVGAIEHSLEDYE